MIEFKNVSKKYPNGFEALKQRPLFQNARLLKYEV